MSRKILFDKKSATSEPPIKASVAKKEPSKKSNVREIKEETSQPPIGLLEWLKTHDLIKIRTLCLKAGVDPGSFHRWMNVTKEIPPAAVEKIIPILKDYGYNDTL